MSVSDSAASGHELVLALRMQADALVAGEFVTGLERINLLFEAADFIDGSSFPLTPGAGDATQGAKDAEPGTATDSPPSSVATKRWRCIVTWTNSEEIFLDASDADEARDSALKHAMDRHPFADEYGLAWAPEEATS